jgi:Polyketide cyclase / dehydrase and lipid transport
MHVQHTVHVNRPVKEVSAELLQAPSKWFPKSVGLHIAGVPVRKRVAIAFGEPVRTSTWAVIPISWHATSIQKLFPVMNGKVEVAPTTQTETRVTVSGMYEPPLGRLGEQLDEALMHRVAEGTVRELAEELAKKLG